MCTFKDFIKHTFARIFVYKIGLDIFILSCLSLVRCPHACPVVQYGVLIPVQLYSTVSSDDLLCYYLEDEQKQTEEPKLEPATVEEPQKTEEPVPEPQETQPEPVPEPQETQPEPVPEPQETQPEPVPEPQPEPVPEPQETQPEPEAQVEDTSAELQQSQEEITKQPEDDAVGFPCTATP